MADTTALTIIGIFNDLKLVFLYGWPFIILLFLIIYKVKWRNYPVDVVILEKRGENMIKTNERAGKFIDPYTKMIGYRLHKSKDTIPVINYDWVLVNVNTYNTIFDRFVNLLRPTIGTLFLYRYGSKQYKPVEIIDNHGERKMDWKEVVNRKGEPIIHWEYEQLDPREIMSSTEFQVIDWDNMNFMVQEQRASIERRKKSSEFWKSVAIPLVMMAIAAMVIIIMFKFSYDWSIAMANQGRDVVSEPSGGIPVIDKIIPGG